MTLKVAIIGAGVGGLTVAVALKHNPNLTVDIYERATELKEIGAVVGIAPNGLRTLQKLGVTEVLTDEVGWRNPSGIPMIFLHWKSAEILSKDVNHNVTDRRHHFARMHRAKLQSSLLKHLPADSIHLGKRLEEIDVDQSNGVNVKFSDGTSIHADVVIGADGIKSRVRGAFVPDHQLVWTGDVVIRSAFDYSLVEDLGIPQDSSHFTSPTGFFFGTRIGSNQFAVTASFLVDPDSDPEFNEPIWNGPASVDTLRERYKDWNPLVRKIIERIPWARRYANVAGRALDQWSFGNRVTLLGDAAHTHGGAFAAGASLAIDDAYALALAFDEIFPPSKPLIKDSLTVDRIGKVFNIYELTRRPQSARVLELVHEGRAKALRRLELKVSGHQETDAEFRERIAGRSDPVWLNEHDVEAAFRRVVASQKLRSKSVDETAPLEANL